MMDMASGLPPEGDKDLLPDALCALGFLPDSYASDGLRGLELTDEQWLRALHKRNVYLSPQAPVNAGRWPRLQWSLRWNDRRTHSLDRASQARLAERWRTAVEAFLQQLGLDPRSAKVALQVVFPRPSWLRYFLREDERLSYQQLHQLLTAGHRVGSVAFDPSANRSTRWSWPMSVAMLDPNDAVELEKISQQQWWSRFVQIEPALRVVGEIDLLLVRRRGRDEPSRELEAQQLPLVNALVLLDAAEDDKTQGQLESMCSLAEASIGVNVGEVHDLPAWLGALIAHLSHNATLDRALHEASVNCGLAPPLVLGNGNDLERTTVSWMVPRLLRAVRQAEQLSLEDEKANPLLREALYRVGLRDEDLRVGAAAWLERLIEQGGDWVGEDHDASVVAALSVAERGAAQMPSPRYLHAALFSRRWAVLSRCSTDEPIAKRGKHCLQVWVAPPGGEGMATDLPLDEAALEGDGPHKLTVVVTESGGLFEPTTRTLLLPATGASEVVEIDFTILRATNHLDIRVTLLYRNRVLQTARVLAGIGRGSGLQLLTESVIDDSLDGLSATRASDLSLFFNRDDRGKPKVTLFTKGRVKQIDSQPTVNQMAEVLTSLDSIAENPEGYVGANHELNGEAVQALCAIANHGRLALGGLAVALGKDEDAFGALRAIQVISKEHSDSIPLEYFYDYPAPLLGKGEASLCAWYQGKPHHPRCPSSGATDGKVICVEGFWGFSKRIERRMYDPDGDELTYAKFGLKVPPASQAKRKILTAQGKPLVAISSVAYNRNDVEAKAILAELRQDRKAVVAATWPEWMRHIAKGVRPLLLISHTTGQATVPALEIGSNEQLSLGRIMRSHVWQNGQDGRPLLLLLGCETARRDAGFQSIVARFLSQGAGVVIGTISKISGLEALKIGRAMLEEFHEAAGEGALVGDVMKTVRRKLLAAGTVSVMTVMSFGDADYLVKG